MGEDSTIELNINDILRDIKSESQKSTKDYVLIHLTGPFQGKQHKIVEDRSLSIGRQNDCDIVLVEDSVSRVHAKVQLDSTGRLVIEDCGSSNGTYRNGEKLEPRTPVIVCDGDKVRFGGELILRVSISDIADERFQASMFDGAVKDPMTKIYNKKYLLEDLRREVALAVAYGKPLSMIMFDIDHFKNINDSYGHDAGDFVICEIAESVGRGLRAEDVFARYGGDEFCIAIRGMPLTQAVLLAERIRVFIGQESFVYQSKTIPVTVSIGVVGANEAEFESAEEMIRCADRYLYQAKRNGRNRVEHPSIEPIKKPA